MSDFNSFRAKSIMRSVFKTLFLSAVTCLSLAYSPASQAEIFYLEDQNDGYSIAFPDLWTLGENQKPDDKLTVLAPVDNALGTCRVRVREDKRFLIYPPNKFADDIQKVGFSNKFWENYLGEYNDVKVDFFKDESGLGRGFASMVEASYTTAEEPIAHKRGIMFATLYRDNVYILDCSAQADLYQRLRGDFLGIIKSVDMKKEVHERLNGDYRPFQNDPEVVIQGPRAQDIYRN